MRRKKRTVCAAWAFVFLTALTAAASAAGETETGDPVQTAEMNQADGQTDPAQDSLARVTEANRIDTLLEKYGSVSAEFRYYFSDKTIQKRNIYKDRECYIDQMGNDLWIDEDGEVYGFDTQEKKAWRALFMDGAYEYSQAAEKLNDWDLLADMTEDGLVLCEQTESGWNFLEEITEEYDYNDYTLKAGDSLRDEFETDPATGEITQYRCYYLQEGEPEVLLEQVEFVYAAELPKIEKKWQEQLFAEGDESRTVTLIADAGTDEEKVYQQTVGKGCLVELYPGPEYDDRVYSDPECTTVYKAEKEDEERDVTVYTCRLP